MSQDIQKAGHLYPQVADRATHPAYRPFLCLAAILGLLVIGLSIARLLDAGIGYQWMILASLTILTSAYSVKIPGTNSKVSIGETLYFTNLLLFGVAAGVITAAVDGLAGSIRSRSRTRRFKQMLFNMAVMAYSAHISGTLFYALAPEGAPWRTSFWGITELLLPLGALAFSHYLVNSGSIAAIVALENSKNVFAVWRDGFLWTSITYFAGVVAAAIIDITIGSVTPQVLGVIVPMLLAVYYTYKTYLEKVDEARSLAYYDSLTGLPNRLLFQEQLEASLGDAEQQNHNLAVMFVDVDHFKRINDSYGHGIGDLLLRGVASRLASSIRSNASDMRSSVDDQNIVISRFGGDEFTILMKKISKPEDAASIARRFLRILSEPYSLDGKEISVSASIGISIFPLDGWNAEMLLENADASLYHAKESGRNNFHLCSQSMRESLSARLALENDLRMALSRGDLEIQYQPILDSKNLKISEAEALICWRHPSRGLVPAAEFIQAAEEMGLTKPIGEYVLRTVCSQILAWLEAGKAAVPVAVNLSPLEFRQEKLAEIIAGIWQEYSLNQEFLELELRENALAENEMEAETTLRKLRAMGIKIVIDDFGTGYSSLSRLQRFNLNGVKIDKSFVSGSAEDKKDRALVGAIIAMAHALSLKVVAEGVENRQQLDALREMGCDRLQGYYLYEPVTAAEFTRLLNEKDGTNLPSDKANFPHLYSKEKAAAFLDS